MSRGVVGPVMPPSAFPTFNHFHSHHFLHVNAAQNASSTLINDSLDSCGEEVTSPVDEVFVTSRCFVEPLSTGRCSPCGVGVCAHGFRSSSRRHGDVTTGSHVIDDNGNDILQSAKRCDAKGRPLMDNAPRGCSLDSSSSASSRRTPASAATGSSGRKLSLGSATNNTSSRPNSCIRATVCELAPHHVPHDSVLHIRSRDRDPIASCRDIQAILLQIRDTLSEAELRTPSKQIPQPAATPTTSHPTTNGHREPEATSVRVLTEQGKECRHRPTVVVTEAPKSVEHRPTVTNSCRQHCHSLPESPNTTEDDEDGGNNNRTPASASRKRSSVRFADEVGMNLNTFVMIPPRRRLDRSASPMVNGDVGSGVTAEVSSSSIGCSELSSPVPEYLLPQYLQTVDPGFTLAAERRAPRTPRRPTQLPDDLDLNPKAASLAESGILPGFSSTSIVLDPAISQSSSSEAEEPETSPKLRSLSPPLSVRQELFRLCFEQPFADLEKFREKLDTQLVCLENVRLEDYEARSGGNGTSGNGSAPASTATTVNSCACPPVVTSPTSPPPTSMTLTANSVILVSIKVKNVDPEKRVFARCTDNDWQTHADLPAQYVGGVDNLGREYDRFCVALRRPSTGSSTTAEKSATPTKPAAAVEFAICYQVKGQSHWDNNNCVNYRIEWFDSATSS